MAYEIPRIISVSGRTITIAHLDLPSEPITYLTDAIAAAGTGLSVLDNAGFSNTYPILIGELGAEQTEIKKVNAAVSAGTSLTSTAVTFAHPEGTPVKRVLFNQWKLYGNSTNTTSGATLIATIDMQVDAPFTSYVNASTEYSYYFVLPFDSFNTVTGDSYSDGVAKATGYNEHSAGALINDALASTKKKKGGIITDEWFFSEITNCLDFIAGKLKRWSALQSFDYVLGQVLRGSNSFSLPATIEELNSNKSILGVRVGTGKNLIYKDKTEFEDLMEDVALTAVTTQATSGQTTLSIDNSYDFAESGSVDVFVSGTKYTITYTGVTRSATAGVLTGVPASGTGSITVTIPAGTNVWQNEEEGQPTYFTVYAGDLYIWPLADSNYDNNNIFLDYFTKRATVNNAADTIEFRRHLPVKHWLAWKLKSLDNANGELKMDDGDKQMFDITLADLIRRERSGQKHKMQRRVNKITY